MEQGGVMVEEWKAGRRGRGRVQEREKGGEDEGLTMLLSAEQQL